MALALEDRRFSIDRARGIGQKDKLNGALAGVLRSDRSGNQQEKQTSAHHAAYIAEAAMA
jgi:hypothetical protein